MGVLTDYSVLVAVHISRAGVCAELLEDVLMDHEFVMSPFIIDELVAVAGRADVLITVDKDLQEYSGISIIRPGQFWRRVGTETLAPGPTDDQQA